MKITYLSSVCSQTRFDDLVKKGKINTQFQNQKFHHLLLKGLAQFPDNNITVISYYPLIRKGNRITRFDSEVEDSVKYVYPKHINIPIINHISKFLGTYRYLVKNEASKGVIVCNIMNYEECYAAIIYRMLHHTKICAVTADVPGLTSGSGSRNGALWKRVLTKWLSPLYVRSRSRYDAYMFLASAMNGVVNKKNKPYIVIEGISDLSMQEAINNMTGKFHKKTIMYAGGLHEEYGIELLLNAFEKIKNPDVELRLYGRGNYVQEIERISESDPRVLYMGVVSNSEVVQAQMCAHLLVNPRPTEAEFVKYSFPSKIMECMASGTPLLTTRIPSMPQEYYPFVYLIKEETVDGISRVLSELLSFPDEQLYQKGCEAKNFILENKNYLAQGKKLNDLLCSLAF